MDKMQTMKQNPSNLPVKAVVGANILPLLMNLALLIVGAMYAFSIETEWECAWDNQGT